MAREKGRTTNFPPLLILLLLDPRWMKNRIRESGINIRILNTDYFNLAICEKQIRMWFCASLASLLLPTICIILFCWWHVCASCYLREAEGSVCSLADLWPRHPPPPPEQGRGCLQRLFSVQYSVVKNIRHGPGFWGGGGTYFSYSDDTVPFL